MEIVHHLSCSCYDRYRGAFRPRQACVDYAFRKHPAIHEDILCEYRHLQLCDAFGEDLYLAPVQEDLHPAYHAAHMSDRPGHYGGNRFVLSAHPGT